MTAFCNSALVFCPTMHEQVTSILVEDALGDGTGVAYPLRRCGACTEFAVTIERSPDCSLGHSIVEMVSISARFKGPPQSANGGYTCGLMARRLEGDVAASLKIPPPLDTPLAITKSGDAVEMRLDDRLVGRAQPATLDLAVPSWPEPLELGENPVDMPGRPVRFAPFSTCFVCGRDREHPDGLCIHPRQVVGHESMVAAPWKLHAGLAEDDGFVATEYLWAALDCPGYFACAPGEAALLARLTVNISGRLAAQGEATVIGWDLGGAGRKRRCGTAVIAPDGSVVAKAEGLWVVVDPASITA